MSASHSPAAAARLAAALAAAPPAFTKAHRADLRQWNKDLVPVGLRVRVEGAGEFAVEVAYVERGPLDALRWVRRTQDGRALVLIERNDDGTYSSDIILPTIADVRRAVAARVRERSAEAARDGAALAEAMDAKAA